MGLFQKAVETYDAHRDYVGREIEGHQVLVPVSHILARPEIEITLERDGSFSSARLWDKSENKIFIPATERSAGRTGIKPFPHPLCDYVSFLAPYDKNKHTSYVNQLTAWTESPHSHPMLAPILAYVKGGTILSDLAAAGILTLDAGGKPAREKALVCWRVHGIGTPRDGCWQQPSLAQAFQDWYASLQPEDGDSLCMITGAHVAPAKQHPKGIIPINGNAKLISANDQSGFTFRGRFTEDSQAATVSYIASQKAHNALRWVAAEQGARVVFGGRTFLCWNPQGVRVCHAAGPFGSPDSVTTRPSSYRAELKKTLEGYRSQLPEGSGVVVAAFDAATTGRLSLTYYNELDGSDYLQRLYHWDNTCCWFGKGGQVYSPPLWQIVNCAFGTQMTVKGQTRLKTDDRIMGQLMQRLISCRVDRAHMPLDVMKALFHRASTPQAWESSVWQVILSTACAVIQKYRYDVYKEECEMSVNPEHLDRSYQFGRLLAVLEAAERATYARDETREPNAIRLMTMYCRLPMKTAVQIDQQLHQAYFPRLARNNPGLEQWYKNLIGEIFSQIQTLAEEQRGSKSLEQMLNQPLGETYLLGYYLMRKELRSKKNNNEMQDEEEI